MCHKPITTGIMNNGLANNRKNTPSEAMPDQYQKREVSVINKTPPQTKKRTKR